MDFRGAYADKEKIRTGQDVFSTRDTVITDVHKHQFTREQVEQRRKELTVGLRTTLLDQMLQENEASAREAVKMQADHTTAFNEMKGLLSELKLVDTKLYKADLERMKLYDEAGIDVGRELEERMAGDAVRNAQLHSRYAELHPDTQAQEGEASSTHSQHDAAGPVTDEVMVSSIASFMEVMLDTGLFSNARKRREGQADPGYFKKKSLIKEGDSRVFDYKTSKERLENSIMSKAESWNEKRAAYYERSFRAHYEAYDMAARRYRILTRGEDGFPGFDEALHAKRIREYKGEFDVGILNGLLTSVALNPYMPIEKQYIRERGHGLHADTHDESLLKDHRRILMMSEERNPETGEFDRYKMYYRTEREQNEAGEGPQEAREVKREYAYRARRQFRSTNGRTVLSDLGAHGAEQVDVKVFYDDARAGDEQIFSQDTVEFFEVRKKKNRDITAYGVVLLGEFISAEESKIRDRSEIAFNGTGDFSLKERADMEKLTYAVKKSAFFQHVNARTLQYYMGYDTQSLYAAKVLKSIAGGFANPEPQKSEYSDYYDSFAQILEPEYLEHLDENPGEELPNPAEAELEKWILGEIRTKDMPKEKQSIRNRPESNSVLVKVLYDRLRYDRRRGALQGDLDAMQNLDFKTTHTSDMNSPAERLLSRIAAMSPGQREEVLKNTAILLLSGSDPAEWKLAEVICRNSTLLDAYNRPAVRKRMSYTDAKDGMVWRMELLDELSRKREEPMEEGNLSLKTQEWQVAEEDAMSRRGLGARLVQKKDMLIKDAAAVVTGGLSEINVKVESNWIDLAKTFVGIISRIPSGDATAIAELGADTYMGLQQVADTGKLDTGVFKDETSIASSAMKLVKTAHSMFKVCQKIEKDGFDKKALYPLFRACIDCVLTVTTVVTTYVKVSDTLSLILDTISDFLGIMDATIKIATAGDIQEHIYALKEALDDIEVDTARSDTQAAQGAVQTDAQAQGAVQTDAQAQGSVQTDAQAQGSVQTDAQAQGTAQPAQMTEEQRAQAVKRLYLESSQYGFALSMTYKNQDREEVHGGIDIAKHCVNITANTAGFCLGKGAKTVVKLGGKAVNMGIDVGGMVYDAHKDKVETKEDILRQALAGDRLDIDAAALAGLGKDVIGHVLKRQTGIRSFDYLLDSTRLIAAVDSHHAMMASLKGTATDRTLALSIARAMFPDKVETLEDMQKLSLNDLTKVMGFYGNRIMFSRNAMDFKLRVDSLSDMKNV